MTEVMSNAVARVVSSKPILLSQPGASALSDFYPSVSNASSHVVEAVNRSGTIRSSPNSLAIGGTSNFSFSSSMLLYNPTLHISLAVPANHIVTDGWAFRAIQSLELSFSNSLAQNMTLSGKALKEHLLYHCSDPEKRTLLLKQCGGFSDGNETVEASIPLGSFINRGNIGNTFAIDFSTMTGFLQLNVQFAPAQHFIMVNSTNPATAFPANFASLVLTWQSSSISDAGFGVVHQLRSDPLKSYNIPETWIYGVEEHITATPNSGNVISINTNNCPKGMLKNIILYFYTTAEDVGTANGQTFLPNNSVDLSALRLQYQGIDIFRADTASELDNYIRYKHLGDDLSYKYTFQVARVAGTYGEMDARVYVIPLEYHSAMCRQSHHLETLPDYSGATFEWSFTLTTTGREYATNAARLTPVGLPVANAGVAQDITIGIVYELSSLLEINSSSIDIQR